MNLFAAAAFGLSILLLIVMTALSVSLDIPFQRFVRDPADLAQIHPLSGVLSNIGVLVWCSTAAVCMFAFALLRTRSGRSPLGMFLLCSGFLTLMLLADDLFQVHETLFPIYLKIPESVTFGLYGLVTLFIVIRFFTPIMSTNYRLLLLAFALFGVSILVDMLFPEPSLLRYLVEDGAKFMGIVSWLVYHAGVAMSALASEEGVGTSPRHAPR